MSVSVKSLVKSPKSILTRPQPQSVPAGQGAGGAESCQVTVHSLPCADFARVVIMVMHSERVAIEQISLVEGPNYISGTVVAKAALFKAGVWDTQQNLHTSTTVDAVSGAHYDIHVVGSMARGVSVTILQRGDISNMFPAGKTSTPIPIPGTARNGRRVTIASDTSSSGVSANLLLDPRGDPCCWEQHRYVILNAGHPPEVSDVPPLFNTQRSTCLHLHVVEGPLGLTVPTQIHIAPGISLHFTPNNNSTATQSTAEVSNTRSTAVFGASTSTGSAVPTATTIANPNAIACPVFYLDDMKNESRNKSKHRNH